MEETKKLISRVIVVIQFVALLWWTITVIGHLIVDYLWGAGSSESAVVAFAILGFVTACNAVVHISVLWRED